MQETIYEENAVINICICNNIIVCVVVAVVVEDEQIVPCVDDCWQ